jgi:hypothetical protein
MRDLILGLSRVGLWLGCVWELVGVHDEDGGVVLCGIYLNWGFFEGIKTIEQVLIIAWQAGHFEIEV